MLVYGFWCEPFFQRMYLAIAVITGGLATAMGLSKRFAAKDYAWIRIGVFIGTGVAGGFGLIHMFLIHSDSPAMAQAFRQVLYMGGLYVGGALIYAMRVPERFFPGTFDLLFSSHQIFHTLVFLAAFLHYYTVTALGTWRDQCTVCGALPSGLCA